MDRGVSNLVTLVILVALVFFIGTTVYLFSQRITIERIQDIDKDKICNDISIRIREACYDTQIRIKVESQTQKEINNGFIIRVFGDNPVSIPSGPFTVLEGLNIKDILVPYEEEMGHIKEITLIPKVKNEEGEQIICDLKSDKIAINPC